MMGKKKVHPLEEDWDVVQLPGRVLIKRRGIATRQGVLDTIELYSRHLRKGVLSARGRAYVADFLDKIVKQTRARDEWAERRDPEKKKKPRVTFIPKKPSRKRGPTDLDFLNAYERLGSYKDVAEEFTKELKRHIKPATAEKRCSRARTFLKKVTL
jgi:hypothetical protein